MLKNLLAHPLTQELSLDDPRVTSLRTKIVKEKKFLNKIYTYWYQMIIQQLPISPLPVLELGTGPGFLKELLPELITSDVIPCQNVDILLDGQQLPFTDRSLKAVVMVDVLHHVQNPRLFFTSAARCVQAGGCILMIEPWNTRWSRWVYTHLHHENFDPNAQEWLLNSTKPLSEANGALPWIMFSRDSAQFSREFPFWKIDIIQPIMPMAYLLSGGFSTKLGPPAWFFPFCQTIENSMTPLNPHIAMFALVVLRRLE
ncbi:MAG: methyltransferase domain-containing protein [Anaerolineaceae bacterium]|nr:methyltransferase domain-containing protein [Anaerolineaceae bacterium]